MNLFSQCELDPSLMYTIGSGKAASPQTTEFLLNVDARGNERQDKFIAECHHNHSRFEMQRIARVKLHTFSEDDAAVAKKKVEKVFQGKMERNLFARILHIALQRKFTMSF